jgi:chromate transporter
MVAFIRNLAVTRKGWLDAKDFETGLALCQMIPGATAMQTAAYVGLAVRGLKGAAVAFAGFGLPALLLMMALAALYTQNARLPMVVAAFGGLQAVVVAVVANAAFSFGKAYLTGWKPVAITLVAGLLFGLRVHPLAVILLAALAGVLLLKGEGQERPESKELRYAGLSPLRMFATMVCSVGLGLGLLLFLNRTLFDLALVMLRVDLFAFGGGFAAVPIMLYEVVDVRHWLDYHTFMNGIVLGQVTPGPILITGAFVGYLVAGTLGAVVASVSVFLPSFSLVAILAPFFAGMRSSPLLNTVVRAVLCSFVGLLCAVTVRFGSAVPWDGAHAFIALCSFAALVRRIDILWVVLGGTALSVLLFR